MWVDADGDCQDTRQEVLIAESLEPVAFKSDRQCRVVSGRWDDPYTGETFTDPSDLDIDHVVALHDAHVSGGYAWDSEKKEIFANDLDDPTHLRAVSLSANRSKGSRGPDEWLPGNGDFRCQYIREWKTLKERWSLLLTDNEASMVEYQLQICDAGCVPPLPQ